MIITLFNNKAENTRVDKSTYLETIAHIDCTLKMNTSILTPTIIIDERMLNNTYVYANGFKVFANGVRVGYGDLLTYKDFIKTNYIYIPDLKRYYYVNDITSISNKLWQFTCTCDVLNTYKDDIKNQYAFIKRNEYQYSDRIADNLQSFLYDKYISEHDVAIGELVNTRFRSVLDSDNDRNYVVSVINDEHISSTPYITPNISGTQLYPVSQQVTGDGISTNSYVMTFSQASGFVRALVSDTSLSKNADAVISLTAFPFAIPFETTSTRLRLKNEDTNIVVHKPVERISSYHIVADFVVKPNQTKPEWMNYEPYTTYELFLPYANWIQLPFDSIVNQRILVIYEVNYVSGASQVNVITASGKVLYSASCQLGVSIPINRSNLYEVNNNRISNNIALGLGIASTGLSVMTGNPIGVVGGIMNTAKSLSTYVSNSNQNYMKTSGSVPSGSGGAYLPQNVRIKTTNMIPVADNMKGYVKFYGKPLNNTFKLGDMKGYTEVSEIHLENIEGATRNELDSIEGLLQSGVIL